MITWYHFVYCLKHHEYRVFQSYCYLCPMKSEILWCLGCIDVMKFLNLFVGILGGVERWHYSVSCFYMVPSVNLILPGHTYYAWIMGINYSYFSCIIIKFHLLIWSDPWLCILPASLLVKPVIVPPGLYFIRNNSGEDDN